MYKYSLYLCIAVALVTSPSCRKQSRSVVETNDMRTKDSVSTKLPEGWNRLGTQPDKFIMGTGVGAGMNGNDVLTLRSDNDDINGFGTLMAQRKPGDFSGKRLRMTGYLKSEDVAGMAGLWLRVDGENKILAFDNMSNRPVNGTTEWTKYELVLDVAKDADNIFYGALLNSKGKIWFELPEFETVDSTVATTNLY